MRIKDGLREGLIFLHILGWPRPFCGSKRFRELSKNATTTGYSKSFGRETIIPGGMFNQKSQC